MFDFRDIGTKDGTGIGKVRRTYSSTLSDGTHLEVSKTNYFVLVSRFLLFLFSNFVRVCTSLRKGDTFSKSVSQRTKLKQKF